MDYFDKITLLWFFFNQSTIMIYHAKLSKCAGCSPPPPPLGIYFFVEIVNFGSHISMCLSELQETLDISVINLHEKLIEGDFVYMHMKKYLSILLNNVEVVHFVQIPFRAHLSCYSSVYSISWISNLILTLIQDWVNIQEQYPPRNQYCFHVHVGNELLIH